MSAMVPFIRWQALSVALFLIVGPTAGREVDSQTDGLLLNVSLPLPTLPAPRPTEGDGKRRDMGDGSRRRVVLLRGGMHRSRRRV